MKKISLYLIVIVAVIGTGYWLLFGSTGSKETEYAFAEIARGNIEQIVSATGTMTPVTSVEVGTQVSGTIDSIFVDFNDEVYEDQILAVLDTTLLKASVLDAQATLERNQALLDQAVSDYDRNKALLDRKLISEAEFLPYEVALRTQKATITSAEAALLRAERNLEYAVIRSPISGIVISRSVESGQTMAASLSTPTLFVVAQDLSHMKILAEVDESDIGQVANGQQVRFEVSAYSDHIFHGVVTQVRLEPTTISNIVTYTVVVEADNDEGLLLPGMTATVDFITESRPDVLMVPNKALRFQPDEEVMQKAFEAHEKQRAAGSQGSSAGSGDGTMPAAIPGGEGQMARGQRPENAAQVWLVDSLGQLTMAPLLTGMTDGINTEILSSRDLVEGTSVISGLATETTSSSARTNGSGGGMGGGPMGPPGGF